jgi:hypothetical protein
VLRCRAVGSGWDEPCRRSAARRARLAPGPVSLTVSRHAPHHSAIWPAQDQVIVESVGTLWLCEGGSVEGRVEDASPPNQLPEDEGDGGGRHPLAAATVKGSWEPHGLVRLRWQTAEAGALVQTLELCSSHASALRQSWRFEGVWTLGSGLPLGQPGVFPMVAFKSTMEWDLMFEA